MTSEGAATTAAVPVSPRVFKMAAWAMTLLMVINLFNYIDRYNLAAVESLIRNDYFAPNDETAMGKMGHLAFAFMVSYMLFAPLFGWLADRYSRWKLMAFGVAVWSLATWASGYASGYWAMFVSRCFVGVGEAAYGPAAPAVIADMYPVERRGRMMSWFYAAIPVGSAIGYSLGGSIAGVFDNWRWAFYLMLPPGLLLATLCWFMPEPKRGAAEAVPLQRQPLKWKQYLIILKTKSFVFDTLGMIAMTFAIGGIAFWMPTYIYEFRLKKAVDLAHITTLFGGITVVAGFLSTLAGGWLSDFLRLKIRGSYFVVSGVSMIIGLVFFIAVLETPFPYAWVLLFMAVFCLFFNTGPTNTILANVIHPTMRPTAVAINIFLIHALGDAFSPGLIGWIAGKDQNLNRGFYVVSGMIFVSGMFWLYGSRYLEEDTRRAPQRLADLEPTTQTT